MLVAAALLAALVPSVLAETTTPNTGDQTLGCKADTNGVGFIFGFDTSSLILPITPSCPDPLTITPLTPLDSSGAGDTIGPFNMLFIVREQMLDPNGTTVSRTYTHQEQFAEMKDVQSLDFPLMNGTQFIACTWSSNLVSGGCQDLFTVVPSTRWEQGYGTASSSCRTNTTLGSWVPPANRTLTVKLEGASGAVSDVGWPACCTDLMFTPQNGTPPYTLVVSPVQHPPVNISSSAITSSDPTEHAMNLNIRYTHGQAFMVSVFDSTGASWAAGPLHAGQSLTDVACLGVRTGETAPVVEAGWSKGSAIGGIVGGTLAALVLGTLLGWLASWWLAKRNKKKHSHATPLDPYMNPRPASLESFKARHVTPYDVLDVDSPAAQPLNPPAPHSHASANPSSPGAASSSQNVYVVHADGGGEDLHIQLPNPRANVIEMPPEYQNRPRSGSGVAPNAAEGGGGGRSGGKRPRSAPRVASNEGRSPSSDKSAM